MKYGHFEHENHPDMKPIKKTREVRYTKTYWVCPNCGSEIKVFEYGTDEATMFFGQCTNKKCKWLF